MLHETQISRTFYFTPCLWPRTFRMCGHEFAQQSQFAGSPAIGQNVREIGGLLSGPAHSWVGSNTNLPDISYYSLPLTESIWNVWPWICPAKSGLRPYAVVSARLVVSGTAHFCVGSTLPSPPADQNNGCSNISISDDSWQNYKYQLKAYQTNTPIQANK